MPSTASQSRAKPLQALEVEFNTGEHFLLPAEYLRVESPAAGNLDARDAFGRLKARGRSSDAPHVSASMRSAWLLLSLCGRARKERTNAAMPCLPALGCIPVTRHQVVHGRRHVSILDVEPVGSYAVR